MLIIFDLDDTLIDTTGIVTPFKMRLCLEKMAAMGHLPPLEQAYLELCAINQTARKSRDALVCFAKKYGVTESLLQPVFAELTTVLPKQFVVTTTPHAKEVLHFFHQKYPLAIVTGGHPPFQMDKLEKAGIEVSLFSMIGIPEDSVKKPYYAALQERFQLPSDQIWVCGDRIEMDLKPAHELGFNTVHMQWGRGLIGETEPWITHSIRTLQELKEKIP